METINPIDLLLAINGERLSGKAFQKIMPMLKDIEINLPSDKQTNQIIHYLGMKNLTITFHYAVYSTGTYFHISFDTLMWNRGKFSYRKFPNRQNESLAILVTKIPLTAEDKTMLKKITPKQKETFYKYELDKKVDELKSKSKFSGNKKVKEQIAFLQLN